MRSAVCFAVSCAVLLTGLLHSSSAAGAQQPIPEVVQRQVARAVEEADADPQASIDALNELLERRSRVPRVRAYIVQQKAALHIRQQQLKEARDDLLSVIDTRDASLFPHLRLMLGQTYLMLDNYDDGLDQLEVWLSGQTEPNPNGLFLMGYAYLRLERFELAIERLEGAMASVEEVPRNHWIELLAYAYARADRPQQAIELMEQLIARDPSVNGGGASWLPCS